jgi:lysophospholipase L1-like esterase
VSLSRSAPLVLGAVALMIGCADPLSENSSAPPTETPAFSTAASGLTAKATSYSAITVSWSDNASNEAGYEVWRSTTGASGTYTLRKTTAANTKSYNDTGLTQATAYCYKVRTLDGAGGAPSAFTSSACATTYLKQPSNLLAIVSAPTTITLSWVDNASGEAGFEIWRSTSGINGKYSLKYTTAANATSFDDTGRTPGKEYCYRVRAVGLAGVPASTYSNKQCATPPTGRRIRVVTFGDSNTNGCADLPEGKSSYVGAVPRLLPADPDLACQVAGKIEAKWQALRSEPINAVNHGVGATTTGGGGHGLPDRAQNGAPQARTVVNGVTRYEAEVLGMGYPWSGGEPKTGDYPSGALVRVNAYTPGPDDFVYVSMGTNDANIKRNVTLEQTDSNLRWMAQRWVAAGRSPSHFMITTLAPRSDMTSPTAIRDRNLRIRALAAELGVHLIDLSGYVSNDDGLTWKSASLHIGDQTHYVDSVRAWLADQVVTWMSAQTSP